MYVYTHAVIHPDNPTLFPKCFLILLPITIYLFLHGLGKVFKKNKTKQDKQTNQTTTKTPSLKKENQ